MSKTSTMHSISGRSIPGSRRSSHFAPGNGTLALDSGAASLPVEPDGFNDPNDLITDITYMKAPEFVRMIETLMGKELFVKGLDLYHRRYRHGNATRDQWVQAMEEVSAQTFTLMAEKWLKQTGFPTLFVETSYDTDRKMTTLGSVRRGTARKNTGSSGQDRVGRRIGT